MNLITKVNLEGSIMAINADIKNLLTVSAHKGPIVTIVLPLNPKADNSVEDKTQLNSLIAQAKKAYLSKYLSKFWPDYEAQLNQLLQTETLGNDVSQGLAIYVTADQINMFRLNYPAKPAFAVGDTMQVLPLLKDFQFPLAYNLVVLRKNSFHLFQIQNRVIEEPEVTADTPSTLTDALGDYIPADDQQLKSAGHGRGHGATFKRGYDPKEESDRSDQLRYFQAVDEYVIKNFTNKDHLPVVLAAEPAVQGEFRKITKNKMLSDVRFEKIPSLKTSHEELLDMVRNVNAQYNHLTVLELADRFDNATGAKKTLTDINKIAEAAMSGSVATLFIKDGAYVAEKDVSHVQFDSQDTTGHPSNLLNDLAITTTGFNGDVYVLPEEEMPVQADYAAVLRFPTTEVK
ncbi:hypothetical protein FC56_GL001122 [Lentilactobacillus senioris DSM 24302 = JCM 17472]|uniref:Bacterial archaeo-eukaryotic release factor family 6 domain-containing protein n=2 Tax=Lentilactobacillus senioris TaxID=931534 RepID=A0A0R2CQR6_9LACO|nr:hypothetical protein FC56_GL001122 [Lentilactobacillus senioris DSM 24302 = JCM 17472]